MSASVTLNALSWSTPDGTSLFSDLSLSFGPERTGLVGRNGTGKTTLLRLIAGDIEPAAGAIHVAGTVGLLRQDAPADPADTIADLLGVSPALALLDRAEAGLAEAEELADADWLLPTRIDAALLRCGLSVSPGTPLSALSGGQRTRAGLAALILAEPDVLLLDEPTNNLDRAGRQAVIDLVREWRSSAIIVSHDREVLEDMDAIVELSTLGAARYGGNYSAYRARKAEQLAAARQELAEAEKTRTEVKRRAQQTAERKARKDGRGHKSRAKGDQPKILLDAAKERAEASAGANARLRETRRDAAEQAMAAARAKIEILEPLEMALAPTGLPANRTVLRLDAVTAGYDPARPVIRDLSLTITGPERIAVTGPNGSGKTTLLALITGARQPQRGTVDLRVRWGLLDQHVSALDPGLTLRENLMRLDPEADENRCRAVLARFRFRAEDALQTVGDLSGGERLRAGLACTLGRAAPPALLLLDEPTNHLDLDGLEALEAALMAYDGALVVVSHDRAFLDRLRIDRCVDLG